MLVHICLLEDIITFLWVSGLKIQLFLEVFFFANSSLLFCNLTSWLNVINLIHFNLKSPPK